MAGQDSQRFEIIDELAEDFAARYRRGEHPSLQEYIDRYPELAEDIRELLPALAEVEQVKQDFRAPADAVPAEAVPPLQQLGDYRILREVGKGGMGIVYEAEQVSLGRRVALKVLPRNMLLEGKAKQRFEREARAAAKLHHTNIVPVFGVGEHEGLPYYVMQFIHGLGLDDVLDELHRMQGADGPATATPPEGALRVSRKELSAAGIARSLITGAYPATADREGAANGMSSTGAEVKEAAEAGVTSPPAESTRPGSAAAAGAAPRSAVSARIADSFTLSSSSLTLPGRSGDKRSSRTGKPTYWQSVAHIGVQVANALEYAHHQGILHRDIKPSNLLLDTSATVWVTDFGLAKTDDRQNITHSGDILGTLRYMPPEAFDGHTDPRSDVYSLGLTLYELLALEPAFSAKDRNKMIKQVMNTDPARLDRLNPAIPRDLVTVVHKTIDREPGQRYQTAAELAADLQRFIDDEPIQARRLSRRERLWRWCRHHPGVAGLTAALVLILVGVTAASVVAAYHFDRLARDEAAAAQSEREARLEEHKAKLQESALRGRAEKSEKVAQANLEEADKQRRQAEANFAQARAAVDDYFTKISQNQLLDVPGMQPLRRELLQSALTFYQGFIKQRRDDPSLRSELAAAYLRLGWVQKELGEAIEAGAAFENGRKLYGSLLAGDRGAVEWRDGLARCCVGLGRATEAIDIWKQLVKPGTPPFQKDLADAYNLRARKKVRSGRPAESLADDQAALSIREQLVRMLPNDPDAHRDLGQTLNNIAVAVAKKARFDDAWTLYRRAAEHGEIAVTLAPRVIIYRFALANFLRNRGVAELKLGRAQDALATAQRVIVLREKLARDNPALPNHQCALVHAYTELAFCHQGRGEKEEARRSLAQARTAIERLPDDGPDALFLIGCARAVYAAALARGGKTDQPPAEAKEQEDLALAALQKAVASGFRALSHLHGARELTPLRKRDDYRALERELTAMVAAAPDDKLKASQQALSLRQKLADNDPNNLRVRADLAASQHAIGLIDQDLGKLAEAAAAFAQALEVRERLVTEAPREIAYRADLADSALALGQIHWRAGRLAAGAAAWERARTQLKAIAGPDDSLLAGKRVAMLLAVGQTHARAGLWQEAARDYLEWLEATRNRREGSDSVALFRAACVQAAAGDRDGYQKASSQFASRTAHSVGGTSLAQLARACSLLPGTPERSTRALAWAKTACAAADDGWSQTILALAHYRAGEWQSAVDAAKRSLDDESWHGSVINYPLLAMANHRLGNAAEARNWLTKTELAWRRLSPVLTNIVSPLAVPSARAWYADWQDWVVFQLLLGEASTLISGAPAVAEAFEQIHHGFIWGKLGDKKKADRFLELATRNSPADPTIWLARSSVCTKLANDAQADADLARALKLTAADAGPWIRAGNFFALAGQQTRAAKAFEKAAELAADDLHQFIDAGWWLASVRGDEFRLPPGNQPDPYRPAVALRSGTQHRWQRVRPAADGRVDLFALFKANDICVDALTHVHSPDARTATLLVGGDDSLWVWLNGRLVYKQRRFIDWQPRDLDMVPITLQPGRNTILCRIKQTFGAHYFYLRLADSTFDRALAKPAQKVEAERLRQWLKTQDKATAAYDLAVKMRPDDPEPLLARSVRLEELKRLKEADADFARAAALKPAAGAFWRHQAREAAQAGRWRLALACYNQSGGTVLDESGFAGYEHAALCVLAGDQAGYRRLCARYLDLRGDVQPPFGFLTVRACTLAPDAVPDIKKLEEAAAAELKGKNAYFLLTASAAVDYRTGRFQKAADTLRRCLAENPTWDGKVLNWLLLSLTSNRLGQKDEARKWLDKACRWLDRYPTGIPVQAEGSTGLHLHDWLQAQILRREAELAGSE